MTQQQALNILKTGANVFLTGEPGSGKTHTINAYVKYLKKAKVNTAITASTGIAATHIGGVTIHSFSGIGIKKNLSDWEIDRIATTERVAKKIIRTAVLIIDEVSMLDGSVLDSVDRVFRAVKENDQPFGGIQVILVGDFFQLPPVSRAGEPSPQFAFNSPSWTRLNPIICYLREQHRQADQKFLDLLTYLRRSALTQEHKTQLDSQCSRSTPTALQNITRLYSHNIDVDRVNEQELAKIKKPSRSYHMKERGKKALVEQLKKGCLSPQCLTLKEDAVVMFTKNDPRGRFVNGTTGTIIGWDGKTKLPVVKTVTGEQITATPMEWNIEDEKRVAAQVAQIPLRLAWAITVHKSQGMSLDKAVVDLRRAFTPGQGYVALSRVRSLKGLYLAGYNEQALAIHPEIQEQDILFHQASNQAQETFDQMNKSEIQKMHHNFIRAAGGKIKEKETKDDKPTEKTYSVDQIRERYPNAYRPWHQEEDKFLTQSWQNGATIYSLAVKAGRQPNAIRSRLKKLNLIN